MYHYIIDQSRITTKNFDKLLGEIYGHLTEYQISGEVHRVTRLRNLPELVDEALSSGARTIVAIGDDLAFWQVMEMVLEKENIVAGYIPLTKNSEIAKILGLGNLSDCCRAIAQRRTEVFDIGQVNRRYFFTSVTFGSIKNIQDDHKGGFFRSLGLVGKLKTLPAVPVSVRVDDKYSLSLNVIAGSVVNSRDPDLCHNNFSGSPHDGQLDLMLLGKVAIGELLKHRQDLLRGCIENIPGVTVLHGRYFEISGPQNMSVFSGSVPISKMPLSVSVYPRKLRIIIGKNR